MDPMKLTACINNGIVAHDLLQSRHHCSSSSAQWSEDIFHWLGSREREREVGDREKKIGR